MAMVEVMMRGYCGAQKNGKANSTSQPRYFGSYIRSFVGIILPSTVLARIRHKDMA